MSKLDLAAIEQTNRTSYPEPFAAAMAGRHYHRLGAAGGLTDFGVSHVTLKPGGISSQRHWHVGEDEFVVLISGEAVLIEDEGETPMRAGDCAVFPKNVANGHHLVNRSGKTASSLQWVSRLRATATIPISTCCWTAPRAASSTRMARPIKLAI